MSKFVLIFEFLNYWVPLGYGSLTRSLVVSNMALKKVL